MNLLVNCKYQHDETLWEVHKTYFRKTKKLATEMDMDKLHNTYYFEAVIATVLTPIVAVFEILDLLRRQCTTFHGM